MAASPAFVTLHEDVVEDLFADDRLEAACEEPAYEALLSWMSCSPSLPSPTRGGAKTGADCDDTMMREHCEELLDAGSPGKRGRPGGGGVGGEGRSLLKAERLLGCVWFERLPERFLRDRVLVDAARFRSSALESHALDALALLDGARAASGFAAEGGVQQEVPWRTRGGSGPGMRVVAAQEVALTTICHAGAVEALEHYEGTIISGSCDGTIKLTDALNGRLVGSLALPPDVGATLGAVYTLKAVGGVLLSGGQCREGCPMHLWDLVNRVWIRALPGHNDAVPQTLSHRMY